MKFARDSGWSFETTTRSLGWTPSQACLHASKALSHLVFQMQCLRAEGKGP
jgi:hypothetical protein